MGACYSVKALPPVAPPEPKKEDSKSFTRFGLVFLSTYPRAHSRVKWKRYLVGVMRDALDIHMSNDLCTDISIKIQKKGNKCVGTIYWTSHDCDIKTLTESIASSMVYSRKTSILDQGIIPQYIIVDIDKGKCQHGKQGED